MKNFIAILLTLLFASPVAATQIDAAVGVRGEASFAVIHADGTRTDYAPSHNLFTNLGLALLGNYPTSANFYGLIMSSSNATPLVTDTTMPSPLGSQQQFTSQWLPVVIDSSTSPYTWHSQNSITFPVGAIVGNVCKFGIVDSGLPASAPLYTEGLIKVGGINTCITLLSTDQLVATYVMNFSMAEVSGVMNVVTDGTTTTTNYRLIPMLGNVDQLSRFGEITQGICSQDCGCYSTSSVVQTVSMDPSTCPTTSYSLDTRTSVSAGAAGQYFVDVGNPLAAGAVRTAMRQARFAFRGPVSLGIVWDTPINITVDQSVDFSIRISWSN